MKKEYQPYLFLCICFVAMGQFIFGIEYANTNEFVGVLSTLFSGLALGISAGIMIRALIIDPKEEKVQLEKALSEKTDAQTKRKVSRDNRLTDLLEVMDDEERQIFLQALKDRYLQEKPTRLIDGELPFDADEYFNDDDDLLQRNQR